MSNFRSSKNPRFQDKKESIILMNNLGSPTQVKHQTLFYSQATKQRNTLQSTCPRLENNSIFDTNSSDIPKHQRSSSFKLDLLEKIIFTILFERNKSNPMLNGNYIIIPMHKQAASVPQSSFLEKFQGKNQKINRQGLLQLLNAKRYSVANVQPKPSPSPKTKKQESPVLGKNEKQRRKSIKTPLLQKHESNVQKRVSLSQEYGEKNGCKSERTLKGNLLTAKRQVQAAQGNQFKLPILSRAQSQSCSIISKHVFTPQLQMIESDRPSKRREKQGSFYSKHSDRATKQMELDQYVLRHLQFLDKFQKQFLTNRQTPSLRAVNP